MKRGKSYSIHQGKQSQASNSDASRKRLRKRLEEVPHRMHTVVMLDSVEFVDDTRAEDLLSTRDSFKCICRPAIWLTATTPYDRDFNLIERYIKSTITSVVVYDGETADMRDKLESLVDNFVTVSNLKEGVETCFELAQPDDMIIYSPSCKVDDGYLNYLDRSKAYAKFISELEKNG